MTGHILCVTISDSLSRHNWLTSYCAGLAGGTVRLQTTLAGAGPRAATAETRMAEVGHGFDVMSMSHLTYVVDGAVVYYI